MNQIITSAVAEKIAALLTLEYLEEPAARGDRAVFEQVLAKVPDVEPVRGDQPDRSGESQPVTQNSRRSRN